MPAHEDATTPLEYATPEPRVPWACRVNGWWIVLAALPVVLWSLPNTRSASGGWVVQTKYQLGIYASLAIGLRAIIGIVRTERGWRWAVYLPLYYVLLVVIELGTKWYGAWRGWW